MGRRVAACLLGVLGCSVGGGVDLPQGSASAVEQAAGSASASAAPAVEAPEVETITDWKEAARLFEWDRALQLIAALDEEARSSPRTRLALGWIALQAGKHAQAVQALDGLAALLPMAEPEIRSWYAQAAAVAGPYDKAAALLESSPRVMDLVLAGQAYQRGGDLGKARRAVDAAVSRAQRNKREDDEADAHLARASIAEAQKQPSVAAADYRWVVENQPAHPLVREAIAGMDRTGGTLSLSSRLNALAVSTSPLNIEESIKLFDELAQKNAAQATEVAFRKARGLLQARDYARALPALDAAAAATSPYAAEAKYYSARAAERMGDGEGALSRYKAVAVGGSVWAERSAIRRAELLLTLGRYADAAEAFASYSSRFGTGEDAEGAEYGRAMALLSGGEPKKAGKLFNAMRDKAKGTRDAGNLQHLEGVAALRAGKAELAKKLWLELVHKEPLTWAALAAHARLRQMGHTPLPPLFGETRPVHFGALPVTLPAAPRLFHEIGLDGTAEDRLAAIEQEAAQGYPSRESEALCEMYGQLSGARRRHQVGSRAVSHDTLMRPPSLAELWAWRCVYPSPYPGIVQREERRHELPAGLVHAVMRQESAFKATAVSPVGARGLMQLMPNTAVRAASELSLAIDLDEVTRPDVNLKLGAFYLGKLLKNFKGSVPLAAAGYNAGPIAVQNWLAAGGDRDADVWIARIPYEETRIYTQRVLTNFARYQWLAGGASAVAELALSLPTDTKIDDDAY